ncbi:serine/threonine-protein kinase [Streptomyces sp. cmx-18-6]|uniref:serine/threonine-protein kinase n=1 Tax=Streptomyces sp. cmx-18-6 TaxID=2790930 RepID=UPI00397FFDE9
MSNHGGRANEPTSYGLQPPRPTPPAGAPDPAPPTPSAHIPAPQGPQAPQAPHAPTASQAPPAPDGAVDRVVGGRYRLLARLGHGGMGTVWRAHDQVVDREVAVKEPRVPEHLGEREHATAHRRMQVEARSAARIDHPSVVTIHDVVMEDGRPWIVMELVRGQSLGDRLQEGILDTREAARIGLAVLDALTAAHAAGILHRDVKPDNVLLGTADRVVLTDFGIAQVEGEQRLTETGAFIGSPEYISPERVLGQHPGPASDLWSLGVVLYAAVEGMSPYRRSNTPATLQAVLTAEPQMPARATDAFGLLVMRLLRKDPAARPPTAEVRRVLQEIAAPARPTELFAASTGGGSKWVPPVLHRNRAAQFGLAGGALAVVLALVLVLVNPFAGDGPPEGWQVRPENEVLSADVAVPEDYKRVEQDGGELVWYVDPSGVFEITFWRRGQSEDREDPGPDPAARKAYYEKGGENATQMADASPTHKKVKHQGRDAVDMVTDYIPYADASDDDPVRYRLHELLIPGEKPEEPHWNARVRMPAQGQAAEDGERIFAEVVEGLKIHDS